MSDKKMFMVTDEKKGKGYDLISSPMYSPDSSKLGYVARQGNQIFFVENNKAGASYDQIRVCSVQP